MSRTQAFSRYVVKCRRSSEYYGTDGEFVTSVYEAQKLNKSQAESIAQGLTRDYGRVFYALEV